MEVKTITQDDFIYEVVTKKITTLKPVRTKGEIKYADTLFYLVRVLPYNEPSLEIILSLASFARGKGGLSPKQAQLADKFINYCNAHIPTLINEEIAINYSNYSDFVSILDFEKLELDNYLKEVSDEKYENLMKECDWNNRFGQIMQVITEKGLV